MCLLRFRVHMSSKANVSIKVDVSTKVNVSIISRFDDLSIDGCFMWGLD